MSKPRALMTLSRMFTSTRQPNGSVLSIYPARTLGIVFCAWLACACASPPARAWCPPTSAPAGSEREFLHHRLAAEIVNDYAEMLTSIAPEDVVPLVDQFWSEMSPSEQLLPKVLRRLEGDYGPAQQERFLAVGAPELARAHQQLDVALHELEQREPRAAAYAAEELYHWLSVY